MDLVLTDGVEVQNLWLNHLTLWGSLTTRRNCIQGLHAIFFFDDGLEALQLISIRKLVTKV